MRFAIVTLMILMFGHMPAKSASMADHGNGEMPAVSMRTFGQAYAPIGHVRFCERYPGECLSDNEAAHRPALTERSWHDLERINLVVNRTIAPVTDLELYGQSEVWTYPYDRGDCEDYVLLKRRMLIDRGWPQSALLITVVRDLQGDGHAILTASTSAGDYLLDNRTDKVMRWNRSRYDFIKRQSSRDPQNWVRLKPQNAAMYVASQVGTSE